MKLWPELRRSADAKDFVFAWLGLSLALPLVSGLLAHVGPPALSEVLLDAAPDLGLGMVLVAVVLVLLNRYRSEQAVLTSMRLALVVAGITLALSFTKLWDASDSFTVLKPGEAFLSIFSLGFWPLHYGPAMLDRFFPLVFAAGLAFVLWRQRQALSRILISSLTVFFGLSLVSGFLSWAAVFLAWSRKSALDDVQDVYRVLVSAQSGGYWVSGQAERFFSATGHQAETGLMAARGSALFIVACILLVFLAWRCLPAFKSLAKRLITLESTVAIAVFFAGVGLGWMGRTADYSYTGMLSLVVAALASLAWVYWRRFGSDLENLPQDELNSPHLPLPSGAVAPHDLETLGMFLLVISLFGSSLVGWPVLAGFAAASFLSWSASRRGLGWGSGIVFRITFYALTVFALGQAGMAFGLRNYTLAGWQVWALVGASLLGGSVILMNDLKSQIVSRAWAMAVPSACLVISLLAIRQPVLWGIGILAVFIQLAIGYKAEWRSRFMVLPTYVMLFTLAILSVFWPTLWATF